MTSLAEHASSVLAPDERVAFLGNLSLLMTAGEIRGDTFLQALSNFGRDPELLEHEIRVTVLHELAHYFGLDEQRLAELGYG